MADFQRDIAARDAALILRGGGGCLLLVSAGLIVVTIPRARSVLDILIGWALWGIGPATLALGVPMLILGRKAAHRAKNIKISTDSERESN